jgi:putative endonuclease
MKEYFVYILTNKNNKTLYIGVTNNLERRMAEHKQGLVKGFSQKYKLTKLIYYESCHSIDDAISREKQLKNWHREWKLNLIKAVNPHLKELDAEINSA